MKPVKLSATLPEIRSRELFLTCDNCKTRFSFDNVKYIDDAHGTSIRSDHGLAVVKRALTVGCACPKCGAQKEFTTMFQMGTSYVNVNSNGAYARSSSCTPEDAVREYFYRDIIE